MRIVSTRLRPICRPIAAVASELSEAAQNDAAHRELVHVPAQVERLWVARTRESDLSFNGSESMTLAASARDHSSTNSEFRSISACGAFTETFRSGQVKLESGESKASNRGYFRFRRTNT